MQTTTIRRKPALLVAAIAGLLLVLLTGAVSGSATAVADQGADTANVTIGDFFFSQTVITVAVGTTVQWTNIGGFAHTSTASDALWDSGALGSNDLFTHTMTIPGNFRYICSIHPGMQGTVVVTGTFPSTLYLPTLARE